MRDPYLRICSYGRQFMIRKFFSSLHRALTSNGTTRCRSFLQALQAGTIKGSGKSGWMNRIPGFILTSCRAAARRIDRVRSRSKAEAGQVERPCTLANVPRTVACVIKRLGVLDENRNRPGICHEKNQGPHPVIHQTLRSTQRWYG
jgi:hypothetical protein